MAEAAAKTAALQALTWSEQDGRAADRQRRRDRRARQRGTCHRAEWECARCGGANWETRTDCRRCNKRKESTDAPLPLLCVEEPPPGQLPAPVPPKASAQLPVPVALPLHPKAQPPQGRRAGSTRPRSVTARLVDRLELARGRLEDAARRRWRAEAEEMYAREEFTEARRLLDLALADSDESREASAARRSRSPPQRMPRTAGPRMPDPRGSVRPFVAQQVVPLASGSAREEEVSIITG